MKTTQLPAVIKRGIPNAKLPVIFEDAVKALAACRTLDEAKYFRDKAEALKAWARIHKSKVAEREARALTLHAFKRLGELAEEMRPTGRGKTRPGLSRRQMGGTAPGARSLLVETGLTPTQASNAGRIARIPKDTFDRIVARQVPPSPNTAARTMDKGSEGWKRFGSANSPRQFRSFCRSTNAVELARSLSPDESLKAREVVIEIGEWLDTFEQHLPKEKK